MLSTSSLSWPSTTLSAVQNETAPSIPETLTVQPDEVQTGLMVDRLDQLPFDQFCGVAEWLTMRESLQLMKTSRQNHRFMYSCYQQKLTEEARLKPGHPAIHYRDPKNRLDRYVPTDSPGLSYLATMGIRYPLTRQIARGEKSIRQAVDFVNGQRRLIQSTLSTNQLSLQQKSFLSNPLFSEHIESGRCTINTALEMAKDGMTLFYSMTLKCLFRSGLLELHDLKIISESGLKFLHEPVMVNLLRYGLCTRQQVLNLTPAQFTSIRICRPLLLLVEKVAIEDVLALTEIQIELLRKAGLTEELHADRITLPYALQLVHEKQIGLSSEAVAITSASPSIVVSSSSGLTSSQSPLASSGLCANLSALYVRALPHLPIGYGPRMTMLTVPETIQLFSEASVRSMREVIRTMDSDYAYRWINTFGKEIHLLGVDDIISFMDLTAGQDESVFQHLNDLNFLRRPACAYVQIYLRLSSQLKSADYLRVVRPFISDVFGYLVCESLIQSNGELARLCCTVWSAVQSNCAITGSDINLYRDLALPKLQEELWSRHIIYLTRGGLTLFGQLVQMMDLHRVDGFFRFDDAWSPEAFLAGFGDELVEGESDFKYLEAFLVPFVRLPQVRQLLDAIAQLE